MCDAIQNLWIEKGEKALFIGDSITDCGRRGNLAPLGDGYVKQFVDMVIAEDQARAASITWINKGIGGNTVVDLCNRWDDDVLRHEPDFLSVKIGINDSHRFLGGNESAFSPDNFRKAYDSVLRKTRERLGKDLKLLLIEPFYISRADRYPEGEEPNWRQKVLALLPKYRQTVCDMGEKYGARVVHTHDMFQRLLEHYEPDAFCGEPVHPNHTGHLMIAMEAMSVLCAE